MRSAVYFQMASLLGSPKARLRRALRRHSQLDSQL